MKKKTEEFELLTTRQAAEYCGLTEEGLRSHIYIIGDLKPLRFGHDLAFLRRDLDDFLKRKRPAHRPRTRPQEIDGKDTKPTKRKP